MIPIEIAYKYRACGFSFVPVNDKKVATVKWEEFQNRFPTDEEIEKWCSFATGIAVITGPISGILMVDADEHKAPGIIAEIEKRIPREIVCPIQTTPRGGRHYVFRYEEGFANKADYTDGLDMRTRGGYFVVYPSRFTTGKQWEWLEGQAPWEVPTPAMPKSLHTWIHSFDIRPQVSTSVHKQEWFKEGRKDNDLFHTANCLVKGGAEYDLIRHTLTTLIASWGESDQRWVEAKVQSALDRSARREGALASEVKDWICLHDGNFKTTDVYTCLHLTTRNDKKNVSTILQRLSEGDDKIIEPCQTRGVWKRYNPDTEEMDYLNADPEDYLSLRWPLGIERKTRIFPKSIIVIAGVTGTGKTSYILDFIRENQDSHEIRLFNSEMSPQAMKYKLQQYNVPEESWKFKMFKWNDNTDVIAPDGINIVDYLEAGPNAYEIKQPIGRILKRLNKGIAIVSVQKKQGAKFGTGGIYSAMDASINISLEFSKLEITKNRFREADEFRGLDIRNWTIRNGTVEALSGWYSEGSESEKPRPKLVEYDADGFIREDSLR